MKDINLLLESIGLTKQESRCYLALYGLREAKTGQLSKSSGIATANIYPVLNDLMKKGLVSYRLQNNIKIFIANSPESLNKFIDEKQKKLDEQKKEVKEAISSLKVDETKNEPYSKHKYYEGVSGIKSMWYELTSKLRQVDKNTVIKIHSSKIETFENLLGFYDEFHKERVKCGLRYRLILTEEARKHGKKRQRQKAQVKYMKLENEIQWGIVGDALFMYYATGKIPVSFLITDEKFARSFEFIFDNLWMMAKA
jgi:sugar-specific transcriptional regulator TrmB